MKKSPGTSRRKRETGTVAPANAPGEGKGPSFPVVGIGASAGGLEAIESFLRNVPEGSGMAFVIVQHLDPTHKGIMVELVQRATPMEVVQARNRLKVKPNHVYVIPPNKDLSILRGVLHLFDPRAPRGLRLPIDFFFRSLADDCEERSIGVILSGMGSDGTIGLKAIKEKAGVVFVQDPASAKFDGMPGSAVDAGLADVVAPVGDLPGKIIAYLKHAPLIGGSPALPEGKARGALEKVIILLRTHFGHDFSLYKNNTLCRRIERRMGIHQIGRIATYVRMLQESPQELGLLFKELLIGVTGFFRDPAAWEVLKEQGIPALLSGCPPGHALRAWVPGCSTGEEAYSLAIIFKEALEELKPAGNPTLQVFATDLDRDAIEKAREGFFPSGIAADVPVERLRRFFVKEERGYRVGKSIREMVIFAPQNLIADPPFTRLDVLSCRNLLIYLTPELQRRVIPLFHYSLNPGGILFLGSAETVGGHHDLFKPLHGKSRLYRSQKSDVKANSIELPASFVFPRPDRMSQPGQLEPAQNLQPLADQVLLQRFSPAAVLVSDKGDILYISGRTGKYLEPAAGKVNWNIFAMAREGLRQELPAAFRNVLQGNGEVDLRNVVVRTNGGTQAVNIALRCLDQPEALRGKVMVVFTEVASSPEPGAGGRSGRPHARGAREAELEQELDHARQELQAIRQEAQMSSEEFRSANEELQSTNEELQSTNEELTTSREEMQSLNEELQTVNHEFQAKMDELSRTSNDMKNLLESIDVAVLFLDSALRVRQFTSQTAKITNMIAGDVGRPITDLASDLFQGVLADDAREVLRTLLSVEKQVEIRNGRWYQVRIMPYRTRDNMIDGVVITFTDITVSKTLEGELRRIQSLLKERIAEQAADLGAAEAKYQAEMRSGGAAGALEGLDKPDGTGGTSR